MTHRSLTPTPANLPTSPATARSYARITRPILTLFGPRAKSEAEIIAAAARENAILSGTYRTATAPRAPNPRNPGPYGGDLHRAPTQRAQFALVPPTSTGTKTHG